MQEPGQTSGLGERILGTANIWRLAQVVLILAAAYFYMGVGSFAAQIQQHRLFFEPHTALLLRLTALGIGIGLCIGLALKDFSRGQVEFAPDWPALVINLLGAAAFLAAEVALGIGAVKDTGVLRGAIKNAVVTAPLLPFVWTGLALTTLVRPKLAPPPAPRPPVQDNSIITMAP